jgi:hypothetical protein
MTVSPSNVLPMFNELVQGSGIRGPLTKCFPAHPADIYSLAVTPSQILSASGSSAIKVHSTTEADFPLAQALEKAHKIGCHHIVTSENGTKAVSVGFGGEIKLWSNDNGEWTEDPKGTQGYQLLLLHYPDLSTQADIDQALLESRKHGQWRCRAMRDISLAPRMTDMSRSGIWPRIWSRSEISRRKAASGCA